MLFLLAWQFALIVHEDKRMPENLGKSQGAHPLWLPFSAAVLEPKSSFRIWVSGLISLRACRKMLISRDAIATIFEPNLEQALQNTGKDQKYWPGPFPRFPEYGAKLL